MVFWITSKGRKFRENLQRIRKRLVDLRKIEDKKDKTLAAIKEMFSLIEDVKKDILARANEEIVKPWIDARFDNKILALSREELNKLDELEQNLRFYAELVIAVKNEKELDDAIDALEKEEREIEARENYTAAAITEMEQTTLAERLRNTTSKDISRSTKDGVSWRDIAYVVRQLGASIEKAGKHQYKIVFPSARPITATEDTYSDIIAKEVRQYASLSIQGHKLRSLTIRFLVSAFKKGDITRAIA